MSVEFDFNGTWAKDEIIHLKDRILFLVEKLPSDSFCKVIFDRTARGCAFTFNVASRALSFCEEKSQPTAELAIERLSDSVLNRIDSWISRRNF